MTATTSSIIRLAQPSDEAELLALVRVMHAEGGMRPLDNDCVRETFARAFNRQGGILAVIGPPGQIRAMLYLLITRVWYSRKNHIEELFNWVHPDHRRSDYSRLMIEYAKKCSDDISREAGEKIPLIMGVLTNIRMGAKVRLYRRFFGLPSGAFFTHNCPWANKEPTEEDIWRIPKLAKVLRRRREEEARQKRETEERVS